MKTGEEPRQIGFLLECRMRGLRLRKPICLLGELARVAEQTASRIANAETRQNSK
jgi:hypothetical protein